MIGLVIENGKVGVEHHLPEPVPSRGEVVIRVRLAGICATDLELAAGYMDFTGIPGHEFVGEVVAPAGSTWIGRRVVGGINCGCGRCDDCLKGKERHCADRTVLGILGRPGAMAEKTCLPERNLVAVPEGVTDEAAVFAEPLAAVLRMGEQTAIERGDRVAVLGDGRLGLLAASVGEALGWDLSLVGKHPGRMERFFPGLDRCLPGEARAASFDVVIDCTGNPAGVAEGLRLLRPMGRLILKTTTAQGGRVNLTPLVVNEIQAIGSRCGDLSSSIRLLSAGKIDPSRFISKRYPLEKGVEAFRAAREGGVLKVLVEMPGYGG